MTSSARLTHWIFAALIGGLLAGYAIHEWAQAETAAALGRGFDLATALFLRLIKMLIAPLVLATLVTGVAHMREGAAVGGLFGRTLGWFVGASLISLTLGLVAVNLLHPGVGLVLPAGPAPTASAQAPLDIKTFIEHIAPTSLAKAMADNEVLQIVVFSLFAGLALIRLGDAGRPVVDLLEAASRLMLTMTGYVMRFAPIAVFAAIASAVAAHGGGVVATFARLVGTFYLALAVLWLLLIAAGTAVLGPAAMRRLAREIREPFAVAFATASSEAAYPKTLEALERAGVSPRVARFVLPLGYSFNLDGSMMYCAFASLFIAQAYDLHLPLARQVAMLGLLMVTSKGIAGVPRASLVVVAATLPYFDIPAAGLVLVLAVDHFLDMGRTATNVIGNAVAAAVIGRWDGLRTQPAAVEAHP